MCSVIWQYFLDVISSEAKQSHAYIIANEAWQSRKEKLYYYRNEDIFL